MPAPSIPPIADPTIANIIEDLQAFAKVNIALFIKLALLVN